MQENLRVASELIKKVLSMAEAVQQDSNGDRIIVTYSGGDGIVNCLGNSVSSGMAVSYFYVRKNALYCSSAYPVVPGSEQPLVDGITAMRVHYGVDSNEDGQVDEYTDSPGDWNTVIGARIVLQLLNSTSQQPEVTLTVAMRLRVFSRLKRGFQ
jgi:type IV pilus assembly protein PilW